jgi:hypothetical protein
VLKIKYILHLKRKKIKEITMEKVSIVLSSKSFDVMKGSTLVESFAIKPFEHPCCCLGSLRAMNKVKELLGLAWVDINDFLIVRKGR